MSKKIYGSLEIFDNVLIKAQKELRLFDSDSSNYAALKAPANIAADYTLTLPVDDGTSGQALTTDGSGVLTWGSYLTSALASGSIFVGVAGAATAVDTAAQGDITASATGLNINAGAILNADVNASAAIAYSKLAALTVSRALVSDGSGFVSAATTTSTEIGYVNGVTSAIQTQLNTKTTKFSTTWANATGTTKTVTHNLGTKDVVVQLYDTADDATIEVDSVVRTDTNTVTLTASQAPATNWRVVVIG